jgi:hypothetical protein
MAIQRAPSDVAESDRLRESIRAELEETRLAFHALLDALSDADLRRRSANPAWTIGELLAHVILWFGDTPRSVADVRRGFGARHVPPWLFDWLNVWITRFIARNPTREGLARRYDIAHRAVLKALDGVRPGEWRKAAAFIGNERWTIEDLFRAGRRHFREHAEQIGRSPAR